LPNEEVERRLGEWRDRLGGSVLGVLAVSAVTGAGLDELRRAIFDAVPPEAARRPDAQRRTSRGFEAEHRVYTPAGVGGFEVEREDGAFRITGRGIEVLVARHDLSNDEALAYLEQRLREIGVLKALQDAGFEPGDEVRIGDESFELDPG
jgi:GTP-binding protein